MAIKLVQYWLDFLLIPSRCKHKCICTASCLSAFRL
jgi:hypothetical protein